MKKLAILLTFIVAGCGSIFNGSSQDMSFDSNVKGVEIYLNGMKACKTPCVYPLDRSSSSVVISAKKKGYEEQQQIIKSNLSSVAILNLTFWPSWLTDVATGGMWRYNRDGIYIDMEKNNVKQAELATIKRDVAIRRFALLGYGDLKLEASTGHAGNYIQALAELSGKDTEHLIREINASASEVTLAHRLTGIK